MAQSKPTVNEQDIYLQELNNLPYIELKNGTREEFLQVHAELVAFAQTPSYLSRFAARADEDQQSSSYCFLPE
jgi:hypothetical protein